MTTEAHPTPLDAFTEGTETLTEFMARQLPPLTWIVRDTIPAGSLGLLLASEKTGKSLFALDCAAAVANGQPFLDLPTARTNVLIVEEEGSPTAWQGRIRKMLGDQIPPNVHFRHRKNTDLTNKHQLDGLEAFILKHNIGLVFIGPLAQVGKILDENKAVEFNAIAGNLNGIITRTGATIFIIHHRRKPGKDDLTGVSNFFQTTRGSNAYIAAADVGIGLKRDAEDPHGQLFVLLRDGPSRFDHYLFDTNTLRITPNAEPVLTVGDKNRSKIEETLYANRTPLPRARIESATGLTEAAIRRNLDALKQKGHVTSTREGQANLWSLTPDRRAELDARQHATSSLHVLVTCATCGEEITPAERTWTDGRATHANGC